MQKKCHRDTKLPACEGCPLIYSVSYSSASKVVVIVLYMENLRISEEIVLLAVFAEWKKRF